MHPAELVLALAAHRTLLGAQLEDALGQEAQPITTVLTGERCCRRMWWWW